jgi:dihydroflavonol-4-reductase
MILVTGGTGLVGSYLLLKLAGKFKQVKVLYRNDSSKQEVYNLFKLYEPERFKKLYKSLQWTEGDILDIISLEEAFTGVTEVYHVAGKVSFNEKDKKELRKINIEGTQNMVNLSISNKIDKFCYISSIATLDSNFEELYINENAEWNFKFNHSSYACSKYGAEREVWRGSQEGLNVLVVYPGIVLGSGNWKRSNGILYNRAYSNRAYYTTGYTGFIDASDVAEICIRLMDDPTIHNDKFILTADNISYMDFMFILRKELKRKPPVKISNFLLKKVYILSQLLPIKEKISKPVFLALTSQNKYSNDKIKKLLSYSFIPIKDSLKIHANNYLQYKKLNND